MTAFVLSSAQIVFDSPKKSTTLDHLREMTSQWKQNVEKLQQVAESQIEPVAFMKALGSKTLFKSLVIK